MTTEEYLEKVAQLSIEFEESNNNFPVVGVIISIEDKHFEFNGYKMIEKENHSPNWTRK